MWAADCAERALPLFEERHPTDGRPRAAIEAGREFGRGKPRDKHLRVVSMAALKAAKDLDKPSEYAARAATLAASAAYTHTDLQTGLQGIRQAKHLLGPAVYAALALELAAEGETSAGEESLRLAVETAPAEVRRLLEAMPSQPGGKSRLEVLFAELDAALRC